MEDGLLDRFARRDVDAAELRRIEEHIQTCSSCAQKASDRANAARTKLRDYFLHEQPAQLEHPDRDELARHARRALDPAATEIIESHLDECEDCARTVRQMRIERRARGRRMWIVAAAAAILIAVVASLLMRRSTTPPPVVKQQPAPERVQPRSPEPAPQVAIGYADPEWTALVRDATETGRLPIPNDLAQLRGDADIVRGSGAETDRVTPAGIVIDDARPEFFWTPRNGATYMVFVFEGDREITRSASLNVAQWTATSDLPRGRTLTWQVEVTRGDTIETIPRPPAPPARFRIITEADERALALARTKHPNDDLLLGLLYARAGLLDEAKRFLQRAASDDPAAQTLLDSMPRG